MSPLAKPVAGPYLLPEREFPFTLAAWRVRDGSLVWALSVLAPRHGMLRMLEIPPLAKQIGEPVDVAQFKPEKWPERWTTIP